MRTPGMAGALAAIAFACAFLCLAFSAARPAPAFADSYTMPKVDISAQVETDGSLHVIEQRTFAFDGDFSAVWWKFEGLPSGAEVSINAVRMVPVDENGEATGEPQTLESVPFVLSWREEGGPGADAYSFDIGQTAAYVFFDATDERRLIELDYTVENGVQAYADVGEVYWKFVGEQWECASENVTMTLALPVPSGTAIEPGTTVRAWGHGPADGSVTVNEDGSVTYAVPRVDAGSYAEARVVFPEGWLTNLPSGAVQSSRTENHLDTVLEEEQAWADQANRGRVLSLAFIVGCAVVCALALALGLWAYLRYGREHVPQFKDDYWRDVPEPGTHPAVIGRLWRWDRVSTDDFTATLMHLARLGAIGIEKDVRADDEGNRAEGYRLTRLPGAAEIASDPLDEKALGILFDVAADGEDTLRLDALAACGGAHPREFVSAVDEWQDLLSTRTYERAFFEYDGKKWHMRLCALAVVLGILAVAAWFVTQNFIPLVFAAPTVVALVLLGNYSPRRSVEGNELCAKCKALRNWMRDCGTLDEPLPEDPRQWNELLVYAYLFGIADAVVGDLQVKLPKLFDATTLGVGASFLPWWCWFMPLHTANGAELEPAGGLFQTSFDATLRTARAAVSTMAGTDGAFASGAGAGGGFSFGGGGGFSSGGGAR